MSIKIKDAPDTNVKGTLKIPVGNVGDNEPHTITINNLKSWIQGGGIPWTSVTDKPVFVATTDLATVNGQILYGGNDITVTADAIEWANVIGKPIIPTKTSELTNDTNFVTASTVSTNYQEKLVAGENLAYINGYNLLEGGNIIIDGGQQVQSDWQCDNPVDPAYILNKPTIPDTPNIVELEGTDDGAGVWTITIADVQPNTIYICTNATRVVLSDFNADAGVGNPLTAIYMTYPTSGTPEETMQIESPSLPWKTIGMGYAETWTHNGNYSPMKLEFQYGFATLTGGAS